MKMRFWDNDFDRMFDEAVEEIEKENQEKKHLTKLKKYVIIITEKRNEVT